MSQAQSIHSNQKYEKLKNLLKELFQLDQPDLDFGPVQHHARRKARR